MTMAGGAEPPGSDRFDVAIDVTAIHASSGGVLRYVTELVRHLPGCGVDPVLIDQRLRASAGSGGTRELFDVRDGARVVGAAPTSRLARLAWEQVSLERTASAANVGVLHSPHYTMPRAQTLSWPNRLSRPASRAGRSGGGRTGTGRRRLAHVVTIHDLTFFSLPHLHSPSKRRLFQSSIRFAARHADALVCVSDRTARELHRFVDVDVPVVVAPHGINADRFHPAMPETDEADSLVLQRHGITGRYVLWLGAIAPHKNLATLLQAFGRLAEPDLSLVVGGKSWPGAWEAVQHFAPASTNRLGFVPDGDVAALLRNAAVFVYPSLEEGFGMPVLEALACGTSVVTSQDSVMADVAGSDAVLVDPRSVESLSEGLLLALRAGTGPDAPPAKSARLQTRWALYLATFGRTSS